MGKTWKEKYETTKEPTVVVVKRDAPGIKAGQSMLISTPAEIESVIRKIPKGSELSPQAIRAALAKKHQADTTCPLTTGIFLRIISEVALEDMANGKSADEVAPFWRVVNGKSPLAKKLSCGPEGLTALRKAEQLAP